MPQLRVPELNYTGGVTIFAAFSNGGSPPEYEFYAAVGRPGEPVPLGSGEQDGVSVQRFLSSDLRSYGSGRQVLFLKNGSGKNGSANDGSIWTVKSMDRDGDGPAARYLLLASYGSAVHSFASTDVRSADSFAPTTGDLTAPNFKDHVRPTPLQPAPRPSSPPGRAPASPPPRRQDDANVIWHAPSRRWIDMQIMYEAHDKRSRDAQQRCARIDPA